ncbi:MAG: HTH domain-containing protein [Bacteroidales bacterium]|nr:HTH domain-containing protein [Bacteroidales bacterium]
MNFLKNIERLERIDFLIRYKNTGSPKELAKKLNISERQIYRLIEQMRSLGAKIEYSKIKKTYFFSKPQKLKIGYQD